MKQQIWLLLAIGLAVVLSLSGCSGFLIHQSLGKDAIPTAEQLEEINKTGHKTFTCLFIAGPPPGGVFQMFLVPKESKQEIKFKSRCEVEA